MTTKILLPIVAVCFSLQLFSQEITLEQRKSAVESVYSLFNEYRSTAELKELAYKGISDAQAAKFSALFEKDAMIHDDLNPVKFPDDFSTRDKTVSSMIANLKSNYPDGVSVRLSKANINFTQLSSKKASIAIERSSSGKYEGVNLLTNVSTMIISINIAADYKSAKIASIKKVSGDLKCVDCKPVVAVKETPVKEPVKKVVINNDVVVRDAPSKSEKGGVGVGMAINISGPLSVAMMKQPDLSTLAFSELIGSKTEVNGYKLNGASAGFNASLDLNILFGKKKNVGIGLGFYYSLNKFKYSYDSYKLYYRGNAINQEAPPTFMRIFTANKAEEKVTTNNAGLEILFSYFGGKNKVGYFINLGPVVNIAAGQKSNYSVTADYEAVYQYRNGEHTPGFDATGSIEATDWKITKEFAQSRPNQSYSIGDYFEKRKQFNVAADKNINGKASYKYNIGFGGVLRGGLTFKLGEGAKFLAGINMMYLKLGENKSYGSKTTVEDKIGVYNSTLTGVKSMSFLSVGINLGLAINFTK